MPLYEIEHVTPLSSSQKDALALSVTQIHSHLFTTPSLFVNVRFTDIRNQDIYIGGKKVGTVQSNSNPPTNLLHVTESSSLQYTREKKKRDFAISVP